MADSELPDALRDELRAAWHRYVDLLAPLRPALHGYCRRLTGNLWDAEDLVQDTLLRAFGTLGSLHQHVDNPRAYLLRTATNLWIDAVRRRGTEADALGEAALPAATPQPEDTTVLRDAGTMLFQRLAPQERAAVVLKDLFDLSLEEIAEVLTTTAGAVKAALHRGRGRLHAPASAARPVPPVELVDRFVAAYNAGDLTALTSLMLDTGAAENLGCGIQIGRRAYEQKEGWFHRAVHGHPEWPAEFAYESARLERRIWQDEPLVLGFCTRRGREALEQVIRLEERDGSIAHLRGYAFCPETMRAIGEALGLRVRTGLYRYPTPEPGKQYVVANDPTTSTRGDPR